MISRGQVMACLDFKQCQVRADVSENLAFRCSWYSSSFRNAPSLDSQRQEEEIRWFGFHQAWSPHDRRELTLGSCPLTFTSPK